MRMITATDAEAVEPGVYNAMLKGIGEGTGQYGDYFDWTFAVTGPAGTVDVSRRTSAKFGPQTIARSYVEALLSRKVERGESIDLDSLIGRTAVVKVETNENGYSTIADIRSSGGRQVTMDNAPAPAAAPAQPAGPNFGFSGGLTPEQVLAAAGPGASFVQPKPDDIPF